MQITKITYGETVNLGNYQSARVEMTAELDAREASTDEVAGLASPLQTSMDTLKANVRCELARTYTEKGAR